MPLQATSGAASYDAFGGGVPVVPNYIEDVFNTYVWTGTGSNQTLTTGIDTSTYGGLFWTKNRTNVFDHALWSTNFSIASGSYLLKSNTTSALTYGTYGTGDYVSNSTTGVTVYGNPQNYVTWTFRRQPKFFDVVTWTGDGTTYRDITTGFSNCGTIIAKCTSGTGDWWVWHRTFGSDTYLKLNTTAASSISNSPLFGSETGGTFGVAIQGSNSLNDNGATYVAYLFAHNAGGFGLTGTDNVISCGSVTADGSGNATVNLGYEPQWILVKRSDGVNSWAIVDTMRGLPADGLDRFLFANNSNAESGGGLVNINATGFYANATLSASATYIYIAIRRGPMKVPTSGTGVFAPVAQTIGTGSLVTTGFVTDAGISRPLSSSTGGLVESRLTGNGYMQSSNTNAESAGSASWAYMNGYSPIPWTGSGLSSIAWTFRRAPSFFDEVCYTGTGSQLNVNHNLGSVPELIIVKNRNKSGGENWAVYSATLGAGFFLWLNATDSVRPTYDAGRFPVAPTSSVFTVGSDPDNGGSFNYVAYLFATCAGVSKVGSYTGTATTKQIDCGFTAGSRFVMIKRTDSTGDWYVWDSARGIVAGDDPYLLLNSTAAEVTNTDYVDTYSAGFEISSTAPAAINANGGTFIFLAIA